jgi:uncharacterized glyoxalase superfamily protein PhnB
MTPKANALGLVVADLSVSIAFYKHLGLDFGDGAASPHGHAEADLAPGFRLMLDSEASIQSFTAGWTRASGSPRSALAFQVDTAADVDHMFGVLMQAGYKGERGPWDAPWGQRYASVIDPDGNGVDLYATLPSAPKAS